MLIQNQLESSAFYNKRYGTFFTKLIWPFITLIILIIIFICFAKKEIVVKSTGIIEPAKPLAIIQSNSNNPIQKNMLKDGKYVKKGALLVQFESENNQSEKHVTDTQKNQNESKLENLNILKQSILFGEDLFYGTDFFGYADEFHNYQNQLEELNINSNQTIADINNSDNKKNQKNADIQRANQLLTNKKQTLKNKTLANINQEISRIETSSIKLNGHSESINNEILNQQILSPSTGIIHIENDQTKLKYFQNGSKIADIYPKLTNKTHLITNFYIPTNQLNGLKLGQSIRFKANQSGPKPILIKGNIIKISSAEIYKDKKSYYKVTARIDPTKQDYKQLNYGLLGNVTIITGKKTWFNYIKDSIFKYA